MWNYRLVFESDITWQSSSINNLGDKMVVLGYENIDNSVIVMKSIDYGLTWINITPQNVENTQNNIEIALDITGKYIIFSSGVFIYTSKDGGNNWFSTTFSEVVGGVSISSVDINLKSNIPYMYVNIAYENLNRIFITIDCGSSGGGWVIVELPQNGNRGVQIGYVSAANDLDPKINEHRTYIYASSNGGLFNISPNGGYLTKDWIVNNISLTNIPFKINTGFNGQYIMISTLNIPSLTYISSNYGKSFIVANVPYNAKISIQSISNNNNYMLTGGCENLNDDNFQIYISEKDNNTFVNTNSPNMEWSSVCINNASIIYDVSPIILGTCLNGNIYIGEL